MNKINLFFYSKVLFQCRIILKTIKFLVSLKKEEEIFIKNDITGKSILLDRILTMPILFLSKLLFLNHSLKFERVHLLHTLKQQNKFVNFYFIMKINFRLR